MAKKKVNTKKTPNAKSYAHPIEKLATAAAVIVFLWKLIARFLFSGTLTPIFWVAAVFVLAKAIISGIVGFSFTYLIKKFFEPLGEKIKKWREESSDDADDEDDVPALPEHLEVVNDVNAEGKPVSVIALKKAYWPADNVPTLVYVKSADGKHEVPMTVLRKPLKPADIPADKKVNALNIAVPKNPAKVKCSTDGCPGEGIPGKHCPECGAKFVAAAPKEVKCSEPGCPGKGQPGKFCPECGKKLS